MESQNSPYLLRIVEWILRIGASFTFLGHGIFAFGGKPQWISYLMAVGFSRDMAIEIMPFIGALDLVIAFFLLVKPLNFIILWAIFWTLLTALMRPISGESPWEFVERGANWAVPLSLFFVRRINNKIQK